MSQGGCLSGCATFLVICFAIAFVASALDSAGDYWPLLILGVILVAGVLGWLARALSSRTDRQWSVPEVGGLIWVGTLGLVLAFFILAALFAIIVTVIQVAS